MTHTPNPDPTPLLLETWIDKPAETWFEAQFSKATADAEMFLAGRGRVRTEGAGFVSASALIELMREFPHSWDFEDTASLASKVVNSEDFAQMLAFGKGVVDLFVEEFTQGPELRNPTAPEMVLEAAAQALAHQLERATKREPVWANDFYIELTIHLALTAE